MMFFDVFCLFFLDCWLMLWIFVVMVFGIVLGVWFEDLFVVLDVFSIGSINIFIVIGLILMMYFLLVKVCMDILFIVFVDKCVLLLLLV